MSCFSFRKGSVISITIFLISLCTSCDNVNYSFETEFHDNLSFNSSSNDKKRRLPSVIKVLNDKSVIIENTSGKFVYEFTETSKSMKVDKNLLLNSGDCYYLYCGNKETCPDSPQLKSGPISEEQARELLSKETFLVCVDKYYKRCDIYNDGRFISYYSEE